MRTTLLALVTFVLLTAPAKAAVPDVLASIKPVHSLVAAVMKNVGTPDLLIGGAASEHSYVLKPSDAEKVANAKVVFWIGPHLETFLKSPLANLAPDAQVVALEHVPGLTLIAARPGGLWGARQSRATNADINPHIWLNPANAVAMVRAIAATLEKTDPPHATLYAANAREEISRLQDLDRRIATELAPIRDRPYIVFHDAYAYFDARYGLSPIAAVTVEPDRPVSPRRIAELRAAIEAGKARCIFREPQFPPALIETLAAGTQIRIGVLDPLGAELPAGPNLYPQLLRRMAGSLKDCLSR
jgi:zinc transport system substrate-binding protein